MKYQILVCILTGTAGAIESARITTTRQGIEDLLKNSEFADLFSECDFMSRQAIRAVFHDATSKSIQLENSGAVDGSLQFELTQEPPNRLISDVVHEIQKLKNDRISFADALVLAATIAIKSCRGPDIPYYFGRIDAQKAGPSGLLFDESAMDNNQVDRVFDMGLTMQDLITLIAGGHSVATTQGESPFDATPDVMDTVFVEELLQPRNQHDLERVRLNSDISIATDNGLGRPMFQAFAKNPRMMLDKFRDAFLKLCGLGWEGQLEKF